MDPPRRYSVSPYYSLVTVPVSPHRASFLDDLRSLWRWWRGDKPSRREQQLEAALIERLAAEMADETSLSLDEARQDDGPARRNKSQPKRAARGGHRERRAG